MAQVDRPHFPHIPHPQKRDLLATAALLGLAAGGTGVAGGLIIKAVEKQNNHDSNSVGVIISNSRVTPTPELTFTPFPTAIPTETPTSIQITPVPTEVPTTVPTAIPRAVINPTKVPDAPQFKEGFNDEMAASIIKYLNAARVQNGQKTLPFDNRLSIASQNQLAALLKDPNFPPPSYDPHYVGGSPAERAPKVGFKWLNEVIAWTIAPDNNLDGNAFFMVQNIWMPSQGHRAEILDPKNTAIGAVCWRGFRLGAYRSICIASPAY